MSERNIVPLDCTELIKREGWDCSACGHRHSGRTLANICIGCPCPETKPAPAPPVERQPCAHAGEDCAPPVERAETPEREHLRATVSQVAGNLRTLAYGANSPKNEALRRYAVALDQALAALPPPAREPETGLRDAWEAGFRLCRSYTDNHAHFAGEQKERRWAEFLASRKVDANPLREACKHARDAHPLLLERVSQSPALPREPDRDARDAVMFRSGWMAGSAASQQAAFPGSSRDAVITLLEEAIEPALNSGCIGPARAYVQEALALLKAEAEKGQA